MDRKFEATAANEKDLMVKISITPKKARHGTDPAGCHEQGQESH